MGEWQLDEQLLPAKTTLAHSHSWHVHGIHGMFPRADLVIVKEKPASHVVVVGKQGKVLYHKVVIQK